MTIGLDGRSRDEDGTIRKKRRDTEVGTLRDTYGETFAAGYTADSHLKDVLDATGKETLSAYLKR